MDSVSHIVNKITILYIWKWERAVPHNNNFADQGVTFSPFTFFIVKNTCHRSNSAMFLLCVHLVHFSRSFWPDRAHTHTVYVIFYFIPCSFFPLFTLWQRIKKKIKIKLTIGCSSLFYLHQRSFVSVKCRNNSFIAWFKLYPIRDDNFWHGFIALTHPHCSAGLLLSAITREQIERHWIWQLMVNLRLPAFLADLNRWQCN